MTLDERITDIAEFACERWENETVLLPIVIKAACYAAIRAFAEQEPVAVIVTASESIPYPHIERLIDIGTLPAGTKLYAMTSLMQAALKELP